MPGKKEKSTTEKKTSEEEGKTQTSQEESKLDKVLGSLETVKDLLETIESEIPLVSGKTEWKPVLTRGFEWITKDEKRKPDDAKGEAEKFFLSLGLGRGVDVTCTKPFHNKTAFQIRQVDYDKLIGTDEGGLLVDFTNTVYSTIDTSVKYQASLDVMKALGKHAAALTGPLAAVSAPFKFTASGELSRNEYSIGMVLGVRILNRTVSFKQTMDTVPTSLVRLTHLKGLDVISVLKRRDRSLEKEVGGEKELQKEQLKEQLKEKLKELQKEQLEKEEEETFEKRLTDWILKYHEHMKKESAGQSKRGKMPKKPTKPEESGKGEAGKEEKCEEGNPLDDIEDPNILETLCEAYTWTTGVTHYVSSIKLGAEMYKTMDLQTYKNTFKSNASVNVLDIFTVNGNKESGVDRSVEKIRQRYVTKVIGRITEVKQTKTAQKVQDQDDDKDEDKKPSTLDVHPRKSYKVDPRDEAVIGYELRSVASLIVKDERLAEKMALAARKYIEEKRREKVGPYYIASHDMESGKTIYLKKGPKSTLTTTTEQSEASPFKIVPDEDDEKKEFHIVYEAKDGEDADTPSFKYYLTTRHKFSGVHSETPSLEQHPKESNATFALHSQLHEWISTQEKLEEWISEGECFLINCENRKWAKDSYFALKRVTGEQEYEPPSHKFVPVCERYTNENDDLLFAFKLIRCPYGAKTPQQEQQQQQQQQAILMPQQEQQQKQQQAAKLMFQE